MGFKGRFSYSPQKGVPGHCFQAQVFKNGKAFVAVEPTQDEKEATETARVIASLLNSRDKFRGSMNKLNQDGYTT